MTIYQLHYSYPFDIKVFLDCKSGTRGMKTWVEAEYARFTKLATYYEGNKWVKGRQKKKNKLKALKKREQMAKLKELNPEYFI